MYSRTERLIRELHTRFDYTTDNNRDLIADSSFPLADTVDELMAEFAYRYLIAHLTACDPATDKACWGDEDELANNYLARTEDRDPDWMNP